MEIDSLKTFIGSNANAIAGVFSALLTFVFRGFLKRVERLEQRAEDNTNRLVRLEAREEMRSFREEINKC